MVIGFSGLVNQNTGGRGRRGKQKQTLPATIPTVVGNIDNIGQTTQNITPGFTNITPSFTNLPTTVVNTQQPQLDRILSTDIVPSTQSNLNTQQNDIPIRSTGSSELANQNTGGRGNVQSVPELPEDNLNLYAETNGNTTPLQTSLDNTGESLSPSQQNALDLQNILPMSTTGANGQDLPLATTQGSPLIQSTSGIPEVIVPEQQGANFMQDPSAMLTQEQLQIQQANQEAFKKLTPEQQKDLLVNNPSIITSQGGQFFNPETNTLTVSESPFQAQQRLRQEALAGALSSQILQNSALPGTINEEMTEATFERGRQLLEPQFKQQRRALEQQLADQGLPRGSEAYNQALNRLETSQGNQLSQLALQSVGQGIQTGEAQRAARFNEISSLLGTQQVGGVGLGTFGGQTSGLDLFGATQLDKQLRANAQQAQQQADARTTAAEYNALGGLLGGITSLFSDYRLKKNIKKVDISQSGIPIYEFEYIDKENGEYRYRGVMAQDIELIKPSAVTTLEDGFKKVDYSQIDVEFERV